MINASFYIYFWMGVIYLAFISVVAIQQPIGLVENKELAIFYGGSVVYFVLAAAFRFWSTALAKTRGLLKETEAPSE